MRTSCSATLAVAVCLAAISILTKRARKSAMAQLANEMSKVAGRQITAIEAAQGVLVVANTNMERAAANIG